MEGSKLFPRGDDNRYTPYNPVKIGLKETNCIFDGLYYGVESQSDYVTVNAFGRLGFVT